MIFCFYLTWHLICDLDKLSTKFNGESVSTIDSVLFDKFLHKFEQLILYILR